MQDTKSTFTYSQLIELAIANYLTIPLSFYTDYISARYTIVGYKNAIMQKATSNAVELMKLPISELTLIDACLQLVSIIVTMTTNITY